MNGIREPPGVDGLGTRKLDMARLSDHKKVSLLAHYLLSFSFRRWVYLPGHLELGYRFRP